MPVTIAGRDFICNKVIGTAGTNFDNTNAYIGIGSGTLAFASSQTVLSTALSAGRVVQDSTYPQQPSANVLRFRSTFAGVNANGAWEEWGVFNASVAGTMFNRKAETLGTKPSSQTWQFTVDITLTVPAT